MPYKDKQDSNKQHLSRYHDRIKRGLCPQCPNLLAPNRSRCKNCGIIARLKRMKLSEEDKIKVLEAFKNFGGICSICGISNPGNSKDWDIDHCHATNKFRGIICHHCNCVLGYAKDSIKILEEAILYLKNFNGEMNL